MNLAVTLVRIGKTGEAEANLRPAIDILRKLAREHPSSPSYRQQLADGLLPLAEILSNSGRLAEAARPYAEAFAAKPAPAEDVNALRSPLRYNAACYAALAGCRQARDSKDLGDEECTHLRRQAREWLQAELAPLNALLEDLAKGRGRVRFSLPALPGKPISTHPDYIRLVVTQRMDYWLADGDFNGVRGPAALAKLPEAERKDVAEVVGRCRHPPREGVRAARHQGPAAAEIGAPGHARDLTPGRSE